MTVRAAGILVLFLTAIPDLLLGQAVALNDPTRAPRLVWQWSLVVLVMLAIAWVVHRVVRRRRDAAAALSPDEPPEEVAPTSPTADSGQG